MKQIARTLELSLAAYGASADQATRDRRRQEVMALPGSIEARAIQHLDRFAEQHRHSAEITLNGLSRLFGGISYLGNGAWASVYRRNDEVIKVYRATALMTDEERATFRTERQASCDTLGQYLGPLVSRQEFSVGEHPLGSYQVVLGRQLYVPGQRLDLFAINSLDLQKDQIAAYCERQAGGWGNLMELVNATFEGSEQSGVVPDLNGADNFRLTGPSEQLRLIDAEPITRGAHGDFLDYILRQAETLGTFLEAA